MISVLGAAIAVEGPDLCGKSTLLEAMRRVKAASEWPVFRIDLSQAVLADPEGEAIDEICRGFSVGMIAVREAGLSFFLDRTYVSAHVYAKVFERASDLRWIPHVASLLRPVVVYMATPLDVIVERYRTRGDRMLRDGMPNPVSAFAIDVLRRIHDEYVEWLMTNPFGDKVIVVSHGDAIHQQAETAAMIVDEATRHL